MPDTVLYYRLAYATALLLYAAYVASLWWRGRRIQRSAPQLNGQPPEQRG
jgi:hypothetical protein